MKKSSIFSQTYHLFWCRFGTLHWFMQLTSALPCLLPLYSRLLSEVQKLKCSAKVSFSLFCSFVDLWSGPLSTSSSRRVLKKFRPKDRHSHSINKVWINRNWCERNIFSGQNNFSNEKSILGEFSGNKQISNIKTQFRTYVLGMPHKSCFCLIKE